MENIKVGTATTVDISINSTVYHIHPYGLGEWRQEVLDFCEESQGKGLTWSGHDNLTHAWRSPWDTNVRYRELLQPLMDIITNSVNILSLGEGSNFYVDNCWVAEYTNCAAANKHSHGWVGWSFCYYVEVPDNGPGFTVYDSKGGSYDLNATTGDLLIFRSPMEHQVLPSTQKRVVIAGNLKEDNLIPLMFHHMNVNPNIKDEILQLLDKFENQDTLKIDDWNDTLMNQQMRGE